METLLCPDSLHGQRAFLAARLGIHVTGGLSLCWAEPLSAMTHCLPDPVTTPPPDHGRPGDNHARPGWPMPLVWRREHGSECGQLLGLIDAAKPKLSLNAI